MKRLKPELVAVHKDVLAKPEAKARVDRMMTCIQCTDVREVDDAALAALAEARWQGLKRCGELSAQRDPDIVFNTWAFGADPEKTRARLETYPALGIRDLAGQRGLSWRNDADLRHIQGSVCTSAWEFHSVNGCPFHCGYCGLGNGLINIAVNIEDMVDQLDAWTERNNFQTIYKWDNNTDINCFEPEYDATRLLVEYFRDHPYKYLLLYTGKSDNVDFLLDLDHGGKTISQWSLAPRTQCQHVELGAASMEARVASARKCQEAGYIVRFRFSPILPVRNWREEYAELIECIFNHTRPDVISLCFFGWMDVESMKQCVRPDLLDPWALSLAESEAGRAEVAGKKYGPFPQEVRQTVDRFLIDEIRKHSRTTPISLCLDSPAMWDVFGAELGRMGDGFMCNCGPVCTPGTAFYENRQAWFRNQACKQCTKNARRAAAPAQAVACV